MHLHGTPNQAATIPVSL